MANFVKIYSKRVLDYVVRRLVKFAKICCGFNNLHHIIFTTHMHLG